MEGNMETWDLLCSLNERNIDVKKKYSTDEIDVAKDKIKMIFNGSDFLEILDKKKIYLDTQKELEKIKHFFDFCSENDIEIKSEKIVECVEKYEKLYLLLIYLQKELDIENINTKKR